MVKWGFTAKDWGGGQVMGKSLRENIMGKEGFWLNQLDKILAEGRPR